MDGSLGGSGGRSGRGDRFNGNGRLAMVRVTRRGSDEDEKNWGDNRMPTHTVKAATSLDSTTCTKSSFGGELSIK